MKLIILIITICLFPLLTNAQASGGQIKRIISKQINSSRNRTVAHSSSKQSYSAYEMYMKGVSLYEKGNYKEAIVWYTKAAKQGYVDAESELAFIYLNGEGTPVNKSEAIKWLQKAGEHGDALSQYTLGCLYTNGDGVATNLTESQKWFNKASPKFYDAARELERKYNHQCVKLFETVIDMNIRPYKVFSQFHLGAIYYYGECGLKSDYSKSFQYFNLAALEGNRPAKYYLGLCYEYGRGVPQNKDVAKLYYKESGYDSVPSRDF